MDVDSNSTLRPEVGHTPFNTLGINMAATSNAEHTQLQDMEEEDVGMEREMDSDDDEEEDMGEENLDDEEDDSSEDEKENEAEIQRLEEQVLGRKLRSRAANENEWMLNALSDRSSQGLRTGAALDRE